MLVEERRQRVLDLVKTRGYVARILGLMGGVVGAVAVSRFLSGLLYGVSPRDPVALGVALGMLVACAVVALAVPVRRATRADPISVLR